jgi:hypothetical protein
METSKLSELTAVLYRINAAYWFLSDARDNLSKIEPDAKLLFSSTMSQFIKLEDVLSAMREDELAKQRQALLNEMEGSS